jgi:signal transduction histidine kinase
VSFSSSWYYALKAITMFYIDRQLLLRRSDVLTLQVLPTLVVFVSLLLLVFMSTIAGFRNIANEQHQMLSTTELAISAEIDQRLTQYDSLLRSTAGLFYTQGTVSREQWRTYTTQLNLAETYPSVLGMGFVRVVPVSERTAHEEAVRREGFPSYKVFPETTGPVVTPIVYLEPFNDTNRVALGYDMFSNTERRQAMEQARDTGSMALTKGIQLVQDARLGDARKGFLAYMPVYASPLTPHTLGERRAQIVGYVYLPLRAENFFKDLYTSPHVALRVTDNEAAAATLYESSNNKAIRADKHAQFGKRTVGLRQATWQITTVVERAAIPRNIRQRPLFIIGGGSVITLAVTGFVYLLISSRARSMVSKEEIGVSRAKDELLALASHQLRTPATGVKQYIGMLREGFAGSLTDLQKQLIEKAHESNERQISTINEMLFVARSDAGHIRMQHKPFSMQPLLRSILHEQNMALQKRAHTLSVRVPKRDVVVRGDERYIRMAIENIVSNAIKYTPLNGKLRVYLRSTRGEIVLGVSDNGVGVAKNDQRLLFKKFSRIPNRMTNEVTGTGIGLYLAKHIIEAHHGEINFMSELGKGSTVEITLPKSNNRFRR